MITSRTLLLSRPAWARGLKQKQTLYIPDTLLSRPAWARGLKPETPAISNASQKSRPAWARGLKLDKQIDGVKLGDRRAPRGRVD